MTIIHRAKAAEKRASSKERAEHAGPEPTDQRLVEFCNLLIALDARDARGAVAIQRRLRALGLSVQPVTPRGQGGRP